MADNLLDKASILLTPTAYNDGSMLSVKPESGDGDFTFSRGSAATRVNAQGLVENVQIISSELVSNGDFSQEGTEEVLNGNFSQEGSELITNGDFATDSDWILTQATISNGSASFATTDGSFAGIRQNVFTVGKTYLISLEVSNLIGTAEVNTNSGLSIGLDITTNGTKSFYMKAESTDIEIKRKFGAEQVISATIDNVSVKEVGQNWTFFGEAELTSQGARIYSSSGGQSYIVQSVSPLTISKSYKFSYEITDSTQGSLKLINVNGLSDFPIPSTIGTHTVYFTADIASFFVYRNSGVTDVTITNISVKEVGQDWTFGTGWSIGDGVAICDGTQTGNANIYQPISFVVGKVYKVTYELSNVTSGSAKIVFGDTGGTLRSSNGIFTEYYTFVSGSNFYIQGNVTFNGSIDNVSVKEITDDTDLPRIDYTDGCGNWLLEPQSTNLINYSEDFSDSSWVKSNVTFTNNSNVSPEGLQNATLINEGTATNTQHWFWQYIPLLSGNTYTISFYAKYVDRKNMFINVYDGATSNYIFYDIQNGVVLNTGSSAVTDILDVGNGWYRIIYTRAIVGSGTNFRIGMADDTPIETYTGQNKQALVYGFQLEQQSYATSYIPTNGAIATRLADIATNSGNASLINSTEGVLYAEIAALADDISGFRVLSISDGGSTNRIFIGYTSNNIYANVGAGTTIGSPYTPTNASNFHKVALKYENNNCKFFVDGSQIGSTTTSITIPSGMNSLQFDSGAGSSDFYGKVNCVAVYKEALTDAELQSLTTI